jgi:hypothetical protein
MAILSIVLVDHGGLRPCRCGFQAFSYPITWLPTPCDYMANSCPIDSGVHVADTNPRAMPSPDPARRDQDYRERSLLSMSVIPRHMAHSWIEEIECAQMKKTRDVVKLRNWCMRRRGEGAPVSQICTAAQIPRRTFYNWWNRYQQRALEGLQPQSKRPHMALDYSTPAEVYFRDVPNVLG